jgi:hypothetical protein
MEQKTCPKCGKAMNLREVILGIPGYLDPKARIGIGDRISTTQALPVQVYQCSGCRFLELYVEEGY